jgi:hypothetical protein
MTRAHHMPDSHDTPNPKLYLTSTAALMPPPANTHGRTAARVNASQPPGVLTG